MKGGIVLYYATAFLIYIISLPFLFFLLFKSKFKYSVPARFFLKNNPPFKESGVWFHACSLGEAKSLSPIIEELKNEKINISVITQTGYEEAKKLPADVRYLPYEIFIPFWIKKNKALVILEAELWYLPLVFSKKNGAKTILLNARMSDKSFKRYLKMKWLYSMIFKNIDIVFAQSQTDRNRLLELGAGYVEVIGNIKMFQKITCKNKFKKPYELIITAASTHEGEEELIIDAFFEYDKGKLIVVPRHPERFEKVYKLIQQKAKKSNKSFHKFSQREDFDSDIVLVDKMGELIEIYAITDVVILGGSFVPVGGHNPLEPEKFGCKLITGHQIFNQNAIFSGLENVIFSDNDNIVDSLKKAENADSVKIKHMPNIEHITQKLKEQII